MDRKKWVQGIIIFVVMITFSFVFMNKMDSKQKNKDTVIKESSEAISLLQHCQEVKRKFMVKIQAVLLPQVQKLIAPYLIMKQMTLKNIAQNIMNVIYL